METSGGEGSVAGVDGESGDATILSNRGSRVKARIAGYWRWPHGGHVSKATGIIVEDDRTGMSPETLRRALLDHLKYTRSKEPETATLLDLNHALAHTARDRLVHRWMRTQRVYKERDPKRVYYLSAEYLLGRQLEANLRTLGVYDIAAEGLKGEGVALGDVLEEEADPGLGNGGLGRLAACFMESCATLEYPAMGYGIRYEFGIFRQTIEDGWQVENPDEWLSDGNPWEIVRPEYTVEVGFGGRVDQWSDAAGRFHVAWTPASKVLGVPHDTPVAGYGTTNNTVNTLRLWSARASQEFDLAVFNDGDYRRAVEQKAISESISKVLYPKDTSLEGKELRLKQQYFFVACSIHDLVRRYKASHDDFVAFPDKVAIQLNDTHPAVAVAELMRVLVDREGVPWDEAWNITQRTIAYTNHTLLPEALERWPEELFGRLLPRHLQIIAEIDRRFLAAVHLHCRGDRRVEDRMAILGDGQIRMAHLSVVGSHTVNGVAELHSRLLQERTLSDFAKMFPGRFSNVTNGVTPRRWLLQCNPGLARVIADRIGTGFVTDLAQLEGLLEHVDDAAFLDVLAGVKRKNKADLADWLRNLMGVEVHPDTLFDVQVKRIHEYKRQLMCALHVVHLYRLAKFEGVDIKPRTVLIGGKAAPGYARAKQHIKLINDVAQVVNNDPDTRGVLTLLFLPNYNVSFAERVIPAADLSEQISLAGKEASGTGNMKFQMNGALTVGTLDGANIEIREEVGAENFFLFGLDAEQVSEVKRAGYVPAAAIARNPELEMALELVGSGFFNREDPAVHREVVRYLRHEDPFLVCEDFAAYTESQREVDAAFADPSRWMRSVAINIAKAGKFSSDRSIHEYATRIWGLEPLKVHLD
ncbi:MAG: glycogen/starch/alpha-glucan phosphorylase [Alphaproteobacteria bacterium]|nr:glycogen/starch/alpha-glucan phosphorylase [Alphaproteobacteria bacterium]